MGRVVAFELEVAGVVIGLDEALTETVDLGKLSKRERGMGLLQRNNKLGHSFKQWNK